MNILIAPDTFKGSLSSIEAGEIIKSGVKKIFPSAKTILFPLADGGEGTLDVIEKVIGGERKRVSVSDPLGRKIKAEYLKKGENCFVEMAKAAGLTLLKEKERDPLKTTTFGVGQIIKKAIEDGCKRIYLGVGGSATNDGGIGALTALGIKFFRKDGSLIYPGTGKDLIEIVKVDTSELHKNTVKCKFIILSDVKNPLYGKKGASYIYAKQKGADEKTVEFLDRGLKNYACVIEKFTGKKVSKIEGAGAAGGISAGFLAFLNAEIKSGAETILKMGNFKEKIKKADLLITGEGKIDKQTFYGKTLQILFNLAEKYRIPTIALCGTVDEEIYKILDSNMISIISILPGLVDYRDAMKKAKYYLRIKTEQIMKILKWIR